MNIHHLNCTSFNLRFAKTFDKQRNFFDKDLTSVTHCLLIETESNGLVLVDAGFSISDAMNPKQVSPVFNYIFRPPWKSEETALSCVKSLGYSPKDVRNIIFTHLDYDHANGLVDFPWAKGHVYDIELISALQGKSFPEKLRYNRKNIKKHNNWELYDIADGENWFGLQNVCPIKGLDNNFAIVPLLGHSVGHGGVVVRCNKGCLLHAGDAYMTHSELKPAPIGPSHSGLFHKVVKDNNQLRKESLSSLSRLNREHGSKVTIFCAHDKTEFDELIMKNDN